jgi:hypothetical protein
MAEVSAIEKNRKNTDQKYNFRGVDDVYAAFHGPLARHGVFYVPEVLERDVSERQSRSGGVLFQTRLLVAYTFYASDGSNIRAVVAGEGMDSSDKSTNKAMSAALKYALLQIFCVPTEDQDDADATTPETALVAPKASKATQSATTKEQTRFSREAYLVQLSRESNYKPAQLASWIAKKYKFEEGSELPEMLRSLGEGELEAAIALFESHQKAKEAA